MPPWLPQIFVIKRDGSREPYVYEKIVVPCLKAGATIEAARKIAALVTTKLIAQEKSEVSSLELTRAVLELLKKESEEWYRNWIVFDRAVKRRRTEEELS